MEVISVKELTPGRKLAKPVVVQGNVLLDQGTCLTDSYISKLKKKNINFVHVTKLESNGEVQPVTEYKMTVDDYLELIKNYNHAKQGINHLFEIINNIAGTGDNRAFSVLESLLRLKLPDVDRNLFAKKVIDAMISMPSENQRSNFYLIQLRMNSNPGIQAKCLEGLKKCADADVIYPFLLGINHYSAEVRPQIPALLASFEQKLLLAACIKALKEADPDVKSLICAAIEGVVDPAHHKVLCKI